MRQTSRLLTSFVMTALLAWCPLVFAQRSEARLSGITETSRTVLAGSRSPHAERAQDLGALSPEMKVPGITLVFKRSAAQQSVLEELLAAQQNPASPLYHQWLTPDTFAARFGVADADIATVKSWLQLHGFQIDDAGHSRGRITFSGTAAQVQSAFGAELHRYQVDSEVHFAPATDLTLPAELAPMTAAVLHLSDFRPKPSVVPLSALQPELTSGSTGAHYLTPLDILTMYDMSALSKKGLQGQGQSIAIAGQSYIDTSYSSKIALFGTYANGGSLPNPVLVPGSGVEAISPGDESESEIDVEYAGGIATGAQIFFVYVGANKNYSVFDSIDFAITADIAPVVSISYGACESLLSATELSQDNALFQQAAAQGQTLVAASGDSGSTACADYPASSGVTAAQQQALAVSFPASSPFVTAVGGTQMAPGTYTAGPSSYWAPASASSGTLLSYVPEVVWNEGSARRGIIATGGGASGFFTRPTWQSGVPGIGSVANRQVPDVAFESSIDAPAFLLCTSDRTLSGSQNSCLGSLLGSDGQYTIAGGTSFATPIFAGMLAILNQVEQTAGQGNINPTLYSLASDPATYESVFHDITSGTDACVVGASSCGAAGQSDYAATAGYDEATGLGSLDFGKLVAAWPTSGTASPANRTATTISIQLLPSSAGPGAALPTDVAVITAANPGQGLTPTGTVSVSVDGVVVEPSLSLSAASQAVFTLTAPTAVGTHLITASYSGDAIYSPSTGKTYLLIGGVPSGSFTLAANNLSVINGGTGTDQVTITPVSGYSGRLTWGLSVASSSTGTALSACYGIGSPPVNGASAATLTIGVGSACTSSSGSGSVRTFVSTAVPKSQTPPWNGEQKMAVYAGLLWFGTFLARKHGERLPQLLALALLTFAGFGLAGCGSSGSSATGSGPTTTPPATTASVYTLTLSGTDSVNSSITASTTFTLTVN